MKKLLDEERHLQHEGDAFILFIMSHGKRGRVYGVDGVSISIDEISAMFCGNNCPSLLGKPKIFFIQACQSGRYMWDELRSTFSLK